MLINDPGADYVRSLAFDLFEEDFGDPETFGDIMGRLTWFLPKH